MSKSEYWETVADGERFGTFAKTEFQKAMGEAAELRKVGIKCDVRKIVEGR